MTAGARPLAGRHVIVTSGPTQEPIDPVRYLANRSSGKQGHAIAAAAARAGARVTLVSGPVAIPDPPGVTVVRVETAREMLAAVEAALPADVAVMAAAVADWRAATPMGKKIKKDGTGRPPALALAENPDILATVARRRTGRPRLVVGFAAETDDLEKNAAVKLKAKGADWIVANDVSPGPDGVGRRHGRRRKRGEDRERDAASRRGRAWPRPRSRAGWWRGSRETLGSGGRQNNESDAANCEDHAPARWRGPAACPRPRPPPPPASIFPPPSKTRVLIPPGGRALIPTGFAIALPDGYEGQVRPRSGLAVQFGVTVLNAPGTIDADYRGEIKVPLINLGDAPFTVTRGMRIAQLVIAAVAAVVLVEADALDETRRGAGGFGSTGVSG